MKSKGFTLSGEAEAKITFETIQKNVEEIIDYGKVEDPVSVPYLRIKTVKDGVVNIIEHKRLKGIFDKRAHGHLGDRYGTRPFGCEIVE